VCSLSGALQLRPHHIDYKRFFAYFVIGACLAYYIATEKLGVGPYEFVAKIGIIATAATAIWIIFERYLWRWPVFRVLGLVNIPDLNGVWSGEARRVNAPEPRPVRIRIRQTLTALTLASEGHVARTETVAAVILKGIDRQYYIINYWRGTAFDNVLESTFEDFYGASRLRVLFYKNEVILEEHFFTNRNPQTKGVGWYKRSR
jgi:SMODS-associating 2TM, beta-strand rich effector domain